MSKVIIDYYARMGNLFSYLESDPVLLKAFVLYVRKQIGDYQFNNIVFKFSKFHNLDLDSDPDKEESDRYVKEWCEKYNKSVAEFYAMVKTPWLTLVEEDKDK